MKKYDEKDGVWRTIGGRKVFIRNGQSLKDAMKESGKFEKQKIRTTAQINKEYEELSKKMQKDDYYYRPEDDRKLKELRAEYDTEVARGQEDVNYTAYKNKEKEFHYAGEELYSDDPNRFGDTLRNYNDKMNPTNYYATGNTYWNGQGKYKDYISSIENLTDEELVQRGIPKGLVKEYRNEAYKYYRWFNDGDKPHMKTLDGKSYASAEYLSKGINSKNERDYWNEVYGNDMETRVNNILDRMQQAEAKNKQDKFYTRKDGTKEYDPYKGTPYEKKYDGIDDVIKDPNSALNKYINEKKIVNNTNAEVKTGRITTSSINSEFREELSMPTYGKGKFGLYSVTLKNGKLITSETLKDLRDNIIKETTGLTTQQYDIRMQNRYMQYLKEHQGSNITLAEFKKWFK